MGLRSEWVVAYALCLATGCAHEARDAPATIATPTGEGVYYDAPLRANDPPSVEQAVPSDAAAGKASNSRAEMSAREAVRSRPAATGTARTRRAPAAKRGAVGSVGGAAYDSAAAPSGAYVPVPAPPPSDFNREAYAHIAESDFVHVRDQALSTFSIDVDTASYSNMRRFIREGRLPPADAVRIEELVNYFDYDYPEPDGAQPFSVYAEVSECPWNAKHRLVHVGLQGKHIDDRNVPARNLVFLLDVSGSMQDPNKLPLLKSGLTLLARSLRPEDRVSIVVYAGASGLVLPATSGKQSARIVEAMDRLDAGGSTNGAAGIELAYAEAQRNFIPGGINRVILATDGDFNVGPSSEGELVRMIEQKRKSGVYLTVLGFGTENLQDSRMEQLADKGNGNYAYIDTLDEAHKVLVREAGSTLVTIAKDVKLQVEFNPAHVASYRLIGYENRALLARDFNDDKKDAGEIGAGHTVTALYEIVPAGSEQPSSLPAVDPLRYQASRDTHAAGSSGELLTVKARYKAPDAQQSQLLVVPLADQHRPLRDASSTFRFAAAVAGFGMLLRHSEHAGGATLPVLRQLAESAVQADPHGEKGELLDIMRAAERLGLGS